MSSSELSEKWIKASIIGTIWAASEIVLGSFLHNLRIPFTSNILAAIAIIILVSTSYKWKDKGLFWRAGLICAIMKTMSPSAVIFGPMLAIFSQAVLLEVSVRIFGKTIPGFIIGSILAMSWNLFQKIINIIIIYGFNIVEVYSSLLKYAQKQLDIQFEIVWLPILILLGIYVLLGILTAFIGFRIGKRLLSHSGEIVDLPNTIVSETMTRTGNFRYSILWLFVNLSFIILGLVLLNYSKWFVWISAICIIAIIWVSRYKRALRQLSNPRFWVFFVMITMLTAYVFSKIQSQDLGTAMMIGIQMNFRAILIILGFSVLGTELYNPKIREFFLKTSFKQLPLALELSFESLPNMIANTPELKDVFKNPVTVFYKILSQIDNRLEEIQGRISRKVFIISGGVGQGKTNIMQKISETARAAKIPVGGVLSLRKTENGNTFGYDIHDISSGKNISFLKLTEGSESRNIGRFTILEEGEQAGKTALSIAQNANKKMVIIDEAGKLELDNLGWADSITDLMKVQNLDLVISVRDRYTEQLIEKWNFENYTVFRLSETDSDIILKTIFPTIKQKV